MLKIQSENLFMRMCKLLFFILIAINTVGCNYLKYQDYHADWIVKDFKVNGVNQMDRIGLYNFTINLKSGLVEPMGIYLDGKKNMEMAEQKLKINSVGNLNYIEFNEHPLLKEVYQIKCIGRNCCELVISNDNIFILLEYNGEIPFGKDRSGCL